MTKELIERLRAHMGKADIQDVLPDCPQAADRLQSLSDTVERLVEALERAATWFEEYATDHDRKMRQAVDSYERASRADKAIRNAERAKELRAALAAHQEALP